MEKSISFHFEQVKNCQHTRLQRRKLPRAGLLWNHSYPWKWKLSNHGPGAIERRLHRASPIQLKTATNEDHQDGKQSPSKWLWWGCHTAPRVAWDQDKSAIQENYRGSFLSCLISWILRQWIWRRWRRQEGLTWNSLTKHQGKVQED